MLTKQKVLHLVLALLKGGDIDLLKNGSVLKGEACDDIDKEKIKKIGALVAGLYSSYNYVESSEFSGSVAGKSEKYREMKINMESDASKKQKHNEDFMAAIRELQNSKRLYDLVATTNHEKVDQLVTLLSELKLPSN